MRTDGIRLFLTAPCPMDAMAAVWGMLSDSRLTDPEAAWEQNGAMFMYSPCRNGTEGADRLRSAIYSGSASRLSVKAGTDPEDLRRIGMFWTPSEDPCGIMFRIYPDSAPDAVSLEYMERLTDAFEYRRE